MADELDPAGVEAAARADYEAGIRYFGFEDELTYPERPMALARVTARAAITAYFAATAASKGDA